MKTVLFSLLPILVSVSVRAQIGPTPSGAIFRYLNIWSNVSTAALSANKPAMDIDSASGMITIRVTDPGAEATLNIYELSGNLLYKRPLGLGNNVITLSGITRKTFVFCVQYEGLPLYSMKIARK